MVASPNDELQTNKRQKVVREFYDGWVGPGLFSEFLPSCLKLVLYIIASLDAPELLVHRSALTSFFFLFY